MSSDGNSCLVTGPAQQDFNWGGLNVTQLFFQFFFLVGGGGGLVSLRYRKVKSKINKQSIDTNIQRLKRNVFTT